MGSCRFKWIHCRFNVYAGKGSEGGHSKSGQSHGVVKKPFTHQRYQLFVDNSYTGVALFDDLLEEGVGATGVLRACSF